MSQTDQVAFQGWYHSLNRMDQALARNVVADATGRALMRAADADSLIHGAINFCTARA